MGARYLGKLALAAAVVNAAINAAAARLVYHVASVPLAGPSSIAGDTVVNAFLVGLFTALLVPPGARREARGGRLRGGGGTAAWATWPRRHPLGFAVAVALACAVVAGGGTVAALAAAGVRALPLDRFVVFKAAFAGVLGVAAALGCALAAAAPEADATADPRWCRDPERDPGGPTWPCDYIDKGGLAVTDAARGCSGTPTWQLVVAGALDPAHVRAALADTVARYPSLATRVQALDGAPPGARRFRWAHDPAFLVDAIFDVVDARDPTALAALTQALHDRPLDPFADFPVTLTLARTGDDACRLFFRQHHAVADGRAFIGLVADFAAFVEHARAGRRPPPEALAPIGRRSELDALGLTRARRLAWTVAGYGRLAAAVTRALVRPVTALKPNRSNDYTGHNGTVHWSVADETVAAWKADAKRAGVSLNSWLTGALLCGYGRWHRALGERLGRVNATLVMETRPRHGAFVSFANHLATLEVDARLDRVAELPSLARRVQAQVERQRARHAPEKRLLCERQLVLGMTLDELQRFVFDSTRPAYNTSFSNLVPLQFPPLGGDGWRVDEVLITTPVTPRVGIVLTAIGYRGRVVFNFNYKASAATRSETETLRRHFEDALCGR